MTLYWRVIAGVTLGVFAGSPGSAQSIADLQLVSAAQDCRTEEASALIGKGADVNSTNSGGYTPLMMAAGNGCEEVVKLLLENDADTSVEHASFGNAAAQAKMNRYPKIQALIEVASTGAAGAPRVDEQDHVRETAQPPERKNAAGASKWPQLGHYQAGQEVLYSGTAGKTWSSGTIKSIDPKYGYNIEGVTGSTDAYFVVGAEREPYWTNYFIGDWQVGVPMAMGTVTDGRHVYRTVSGGMRLPPLRINADGSYSWRVQDGKAEKLIKGHWEPNPKGPGVILKNAEQGADWLVYNNSRTDSILGETVILSSDCCTYYDGSRLD